RLTPVRKLSGTSSRATPPNVSKACTCASIHEPNVVSVNASTYVYAENDSAATNNHACLSSPVRPSTNSIVSPAQSTSICSPGSRAIRIDAPVDRTHRRYCSLKNEYWYGTPPVWRQLATYSFHNSSNVTDGRANSRCTYSKSGITRSESGLAGSGNSR